MTDPITFAVIKAGLDTIVDDMAYAVMRTARSPIVRDVLDYSATLCDAKGRILAQRRPWRCISGPSPTPWTSSSPGSPAISAPATSSS